jgi:hypothetical protein
MRLVLVALQAVGLFAALAAIGGLLYAISIWDGYEKGRAQRARQVEQDAWVLGVRNRKINPTPKPTPKYQAERASEAVQAVLRG